MLLNHLFHKFIIILLEIYNSSMIYLFFNLMEIRTNHELRSVLVVQYLMLITQQHNKYNGNVKYPFLLINILVANSFYHQQLLSNYIMHLSKHTLLMNHHLVLIFPMIIQIYLLKLRNLLTYLILYIILMLNSNQLDKLLMDVIHNIKLISLLMLLI